jgi:manganese-dependent inorganic pyrophosphatase
MQPEVLSVTPDATAAEALGLMDEHDIRVLPVLDADRRCHGLLSLFKLSKFLFPAANRIIDSRRVLSSLDTLAKTLGGQLIIGHEARREEELILMISAMAIGTFTQRMELFPLDKLAVVIGDRTNVQEVAVRKGVRVLIVTGEETIEPQVLEVARQNRVSIITSPHDTLTTASLCRSAVAIRHMINEQFLSFREDAPLSAVRAEAAASGYAAFPVTDAEGRTVGILSKTDFLKPVERKLILVDHNELSQAVQGADEVEIVEIIDHHRRANDTAADFVPQRTRRLHQHDCRRLFFPARRGTAKANCWFAFGRTGFRHAQFDFAHDHGARFGNSGQA